MRGKRGDTKELKKEKRYKIIRFKQGQWTKTIKRGLTLKEAQKHCKDPKTHGDGWFDGYTEEKS